MVKNGEIMRRKRVLPVFLIEPSADGLGDLSRRATTQWAWWPCVSSILRVEPEQLIDKALERVFQGGGGLASSGSAVKPPCTSLRSASVSFSST